MHVGLSTLLPELHLQLMLANLLLEQDLFSEYQNIFHVLKYSDLKWVMVIDSSSNLTHRLDVPGGFLCHPDQHGAIVSSLCNLGHLAKE